VDIRIVEETIAEIGELAPIPSDTRVIDASGLLVLPGGIDAHTHLRAAEGFDVVDDYETVTAEDGVAGLEVAREHEPDLVILDLMMPRKSGTDFYRRLASDKALAHTPIIVVSGLAGRHLAVKKPEAVFDKPIVPAEFLAAVRKALGEEDGL